MMFEFTSANWEAEVTNSKTPVLVDFYTNWCGPCRAMAPTLESLAEKLKDKVKIGKLNTDENGDLAVKYGISSIPQLLLFCGSNEPKRKAVGLQSEKGIMNLLNEVVS